MAKPRKRKAAQIARKNLQQHTPWYENNVLWGSAATGIGITITVVAAMKQDLRWLLFVAWPFFVVAVWPIARAFSSTKARYYTFSLATIVFGVLLYGLNLWLEPSEAEPQIRPYNLSGIRREQLIARLRNYKGLRDRLRFGCLASSEYACVAAGRFMVAFSEAGWEIDGRRVYRLESYIPTFGVSLVSRTPENAPSDLPPHQGVWVKVTDSQTIISEGLKEIGIPSDGATEKDLPSGILGVYFGPEP